MTIFLGTIPEGRAVDRTDDTTVATMVRTDFDTFYRTRRDEIAAALAFTCRSATLGAEAADEAMARAFARWDTVGDYDNPAGWVYRVGLNWTRSLLRRRHREDLGGVEDLARLDPDVSVDLDRALAGLDEAHRAVVVLRHLLGFSTLEVADALDIAEGTVKSRLSRALDQLRTALETDR